MAGSELTATTLTATPDYKRSQRARYKSEALFAELKRQIKLRRVRLRRLWNIGEQCYLAVTAQNFHGAKLSADTARQME